jgi:hypothetical protein
MANISKFRQTLKDIRVEAVKELVSIMKKHDRKEVDDTCTLDNIRVVNGTEPYLIFGCSSSYDCEDVTSNDISIDNLIEILDWVLSNEEWLFESEEV